MKKPKKYNPYEEHCDECSQALYDDLIGVEKIYDQLGYRKSVSFITGFLEWLNTEHKLEGKTREEIGRIRKKKGYI